VRPLAVLGATGSIGRQALEVAADIGAEVVALAARRGSDEFLAVAAAHPGARVAIIDFNAQIPDGTFQFGVPEQQLDGPQVLGPTID